MREYWDARFAVEDRFIVTGNQLKSDVVDLATGEKYRALSHDEATSRAARANTMWHFRRPEVEIENYLGAMDQRLRDRIGLPPRENADELRALLAREVTIHDLAQRIGPSLDVPAVELAPLPDLRAKPVAQPSRRRRAPSEPAPSDPLSDLPGDVRQQLDAYRQRLQLSAQTLEVLATVQKTRTALTTVRDADLALKASNDTFRDAMFALYGPNHEAAIAAHAEMARTHTAWAADNVLGTKPTNFAALNPATTLTPLGRRRATEIGRMAESAAAAAAELRNAAGLHARTLDSVRKELRLPPTLGVEQILAHCQRRLSDAQLQHSHIRSAIQKLGTRGTQSALQKEMDTLTTDQRARVLALTPDLAPLVQNEKSTRSLSNDPDRGSRGGFGL